MKIPEHRAAARIAWRQAWRAKARTALVLTLIALPVMGLAGAGFMIKTAMPSPEEEAAAQLGTAEFVIDGEDLTAADIERLAPAGSRIAGERELYSMRVSGGTQAFVTILEYSVAADRPPVAPMHALLRGRMPSAPGEAALHPKTMRGMSARLGGDVVFEDWDLKVKVVGEVVRRERLNDELVITGPGTLGAREGNTQSGWLIDLPSGGSQEEAYEAFSRDPRIFNVLGRNDLIEFRASEEAVVTGASFGLAALALFATGLIAAAAIGVGARRQLRTLGLVGATGGEPRHVRAIVLWTGTVLGVVGSLIGVALAVAFAYAAAPQLDQLVGRVIGEVRIPGLIMAGAVLLGTIAATVAAIGPARHAAQLQTVDALAGRTPAPRAPGSLARRGVVAVAGGALFVGLATAWREDKLLMIALIPTLGGFLLAIPLLVTWIGRASTHLPTSLRLAARQTGRYGRRTGAAVAAATLALTIPIAIAAFSRSDEARYNRRQPLALDQMLVGIVPLNVTKETVPLPDVLIRAAREAVPGSIVAPLADAAAPAPPPGPRKGLLPVVDWPASVEGPSRTTEDGVEYYEGGSLVIADEDLLRAMHAERALPMLSSGEILALGAPVENGMLRLRLPPRSAEEQDRVIEASAVEVGGLVTEDESFLPRYVISEAGAARYGLHPGVATSALLRAPHTLTDDQIARVKNSMAGVSGAHAESIHDYRVDSTPARLLVTGAAAAVALVIVAVAVALVGAESRREHAILVAVGAEPGTRRKMVAANAFLVAALAGVLAAPAGFLPIAVIVFARGGGWPIVVPWAEIGIVALGAPLVAAVIAGIFSREPSNRALLRPVW